MHGTRHLLAADIGGTNSRFGHFLLSPDGAIELAGEVWLPTHGAATFVELLSSLDDTPLGLRPSEADATIFAVPGAVVGERISFANVAWDLDLGEVRRAFGPSLAACINDFTAQALGCRLLGHTAEVVIPGAMDPCKVQSVVGAGTGLGHAALLPQPGDSVLALACEAGHTSMGFTGRDELAFAEYMLGITGEHYVRRDSVVSGSGLVHLHRFLTGQNLTAAQVGEALTPQSQTTAFFARFYGRVVRDFTLTVLAIGGVFISGGVAAKNPVIVHHPEFIREFHDSPPLAGVLAAIPVRLMRDERTGLFGAAHFAKTLLAQTS